MREKVKVIKIVSWKIYSWRPFFALTFINIFQLLVGNYIELHLSSYKVMSRWLGGQSTGRRLITEVKQHQPRQCLGGSHLETRRSVCIFALWYTVGSLPKRNALRVMVFRDRNFRIASRALKARDRSYEIA